MSYLVKYEDGYHLFQEGNGDEPPTDLGLFDPNGAVAPPTGFRSSEQTEGIAGIGSYGIDGRQALDTPTWANGMTPVWQNADKWGNLQNGVLSDYWTDGQYIYANPGTGSRYGAPAGVYDPAVGANRLMPLSQAQQLNETLIRNNPGGSGGDFITKFLDAGGGVAALMALTGIGAATGFGGALGAGAAGGEAGLAGIYNTGAGGFGAPLSAYEATLPISAGIDAGAAGLTGSLTGTGGLTPFADAAAAGNGFTSSIGYGANAPVSGVSGSVGAGTETVAGQAAGGGGGGSTNQPFQSNFNINDPSTWPNISTPNGTGYSLSSTPNQPDLLSQYLTPTTNTGGLPSAGSVVDLANSTNMTGGVGSTATGTGATANSSAISRILKGTATTEDWLSVGGQLGTGLLGAYSSSQQANALQGVADRNRADRAPFLAKATQYLNDPASYAAGPGQAALKGTLAGLSVQGNPFGSGTALQFATDTGNKNWLNTVNTLGNLGLGGQGIQADLDTQAVGSQNNMWNALGATANNIFNPPKTGAQSLSELMNLINR